MKKTLLLRVLSISIGLLFITSQVFASPAAPAPSAQDTTTTATSTSTPTPTPTSTEAVRRPKHHVYRGTITALSQTSLTLTLSDGAALPMRITAQSIIRIPGQSRKNLQVGMLASVLALADENKNLTILGALVVPGQPLRVHRVGTVTAYTAGASLTILATDGLSYTFILTNRTEILPDYLAGTLAVGARVTIIAPRDAPQAGALATGIVLHPSASP